MSTPKAVRGFSLIELMIAIAVFAILTAIAVPSLIDFMRRNAITNQTNEFLGALKFARSTAITRSTMVSICPSSTSSSTTPTCATNNTFNTGWLLYTTKTAGAVYASSTDELLRVGQDVPSASVQGPTTVPVVTFDARGGSNYGAISFYVCAKASSDTVGQSGTRYAGRRIDVQSGGRSGSTPLATATSKASAQALCTSP
jgi:type IV fimbrial biogenesis protein FimT